jgi:hypothetical protein
MAPKQLLHPYAQANPNNVNSMIINNPHNFQHNRGNNIMPLNANQIGIPIPNYVYSHIGPNNQGFLSPTSLQNKLRVI